MSRRNKQQHKHQHDTSSDSVASPEPSDQDIEDARRLHKILRRRIPTHILVNDDSSDQSDAHSLMLIQTIIDRRIKLLSTSSRKLSFIVLSTSDLASTIRLVPDSNSSDDDSNTTTVTVRPLKDINQNSKKEPFHMDLVRQLSRIVNDQYTRKLNRNLHGIFVHLAGDTSSQRCADVLLAALQCFFLDTQPGIERLDLQGVVTVLRPANVHGLNGTLCALTDRFVLASAPTTSLEKRAIKHEINGVTMASVLSSMNDRCEVVNGSINTINNLLVLDPTSTEIVDEIFAYSRVVVTQVFPEDDDYRRPVKKKTSLLASPSDSSPVFFETLVTLPNHKSLDMHKFHFWMESLLETEHPPLRIKGLLALRGSRSKYILQSVGQSFGLEESHEQFWNQTRRCTLLFVGTKKLDDKKLKQELLHCMGTESCLESWYWWADAHCCVMMLLLILIGLLGGLAFFASIDFGYLDVKLLAQIFGTNGDEISEGLEAE